MQMIIDIPDCVKKNISNAFVYGTETSKYIVDTVIDAVTKGIILPNNQGMYDADGYTEPIEIAIKALERESVLEDIKAEIEAEIDKCHSDGRYSYDTSRVGLRKALEIIEQRISAE